MSNVFFIEVGRIGLVPGNIDIKKRMFKPKRPPPA
jgi:hypothetical protein